MGKNTKVTFIIRTKNEERWIGYAIQSIIDKVYKPEIIIVDNGSTDNTLLIAKYFVQDPLLNSPPSKNYTKLKL